ncbi:MAG: ATP-dependent 6-phosphofructokinase [Planctomycetota bacterium]|nr:ATP-dependent 6-phosphofructokinase [Planctomycetota bacterium]
MLKPTDLQIATLGDGRFASPLKLSTTEQDGLGDFVRDDLRVYFDIETHVGQTPPTQPLCFEKAGPRQQLFFQPSVTTAAIVTCGGLCPGVNNVIRSIYLEATQNYDVKSVLGIRHGFRGLNPQFGLEPIVITPELVEEIHKLGGTVLGTSRGPQAAPIIVDFLAQRGIDILFCVGGDGTQRGAHAIYEEIAGRQLPISVIGIPKTIDNDIAYVDRTFGYLTALEESQQVLRGAHVEARAAINGIALVKLMGRHAGFIAAGAALASQEADLVLVPEVQFPLHGEDGCLAALQQRIGKHQHAVVVVAEGAGQHLMSHEDRGCDASGNVKHQDIGVFLRDKIVEYFAKREIPISLKYIDPSYMIRSVPANCADRLLCDQLARHAVHAGMAGKTNAMIGLRHNKFIHVPISAATTRTKYLQVEGDRWTSVLLSTRQPRWPSRAAD